jgi:hypothetical protein
VELTPEVLYSEQKITHAAREQMVNFVLSEDRILFAVIPDNLMLLIIEVYHGKELVVYAYICSPF